jgi:DNA polymerase I
VLNGFEIRTEAKLVRYPDRYRDPRGERMWDEILSILPTVTA